ncbi:MAG: RelA/SpoT domain-containing protein [Alphaproteobacteria bacterium]|nr:RelA/SpoT domain-containing protein [Alphaproteobacteria bacterium]
METLFGSVVDLEYDYYSVKLGAAMPFVEPAGYSKGELDRVGERIRVGRVLTADMHTLENWRAAHLYVINTFQSGMRSRRSRFGMNDSVTIAQRLKRRPTIIDKLIREPGMSLSRMHDIAGCRLIFPDTGTLGQYRDSVLMTKAAHDIVGDKDRYDYIRNPKMTGYRGIHDVYKYNVNSVGGKKWNGLRIEIQYRTRVQHAWATAVEISDIVNATRIKFNDAKEEISRLFILSSELLSRAHENLPGPCPSIHDADLVHEFIQLEDRIHGILRLRNITSQQFQQFARTSKLFLLINHTSGDREGTFQAEAFADSAAAVQRYSFLERELQGVADVVLVGASQQDQIKLAYTNYFSDASEFIALIDSAVEKLKQAVGSVWTAPPMQVF